LFRRSNPNRCSLSGDIVGENGVFDEDLLSRLDVDPTTNAIRHIEVRVAPERLSIATVVDAVGVKQVCPIKQGWAVLGIGSWIGSATFLADDAVVVSLRAIVKHLHGLLWQHA
jgi:hypothetical protein